MLADCHGRGGRDVLDEPSGEAVAAWPAGRVRSFALRLPPRIGAALDAVIAEAMRALTRRHAARA